MALNPWRFELIDIRRSVKADAMQFRWLPTISNNLVRARLDWLLWILECTPIWLGYAIYYGLILLIKVAWFMMIFFITS